MHELLGDGVCQAANARLVGEGAAIDGDFDHQAAAGFCGVQSGCPPGSAGEAECAAAAGHRSLRTFLRVSVNLRAIVL